MRPSEWDDFYRDIAARGIKVPIEVLADGTIVDGRHRHRAALQLGMKQVPIVDAPLNGDEPDVYMLKAAVLRRHLTDDQRAVIAARWKEGNKQQRGGDRKSEEYKSTAPRRAVDIDSSPTRMEATRLFNVSRRKVDQASYVQSHAPDLANKVHSGGLKLSKAYYQTAKSTLEAPVTPTEGNQPTICLADYEQWLAGQPECDLLMTDPPYSTEVADIAGFSQKWLPLALGKLKASGRAYIFIGAYPHELEAYLGIKPTGLTLANVLVWTYRNTLGPAPKLDYKLNWQAILYYRGCEAPPLDCPLLLEQFAVQEVSAPDGRTGIRHSEWQKPDKLVEQFIRHSTKPGQLILDCFAGTGTILLAGAKLGRHAHGCDISQGMVDIAVKRGCRLV